MMGYIIAAIILLLVLILFLKVQVEVKIVIKNGKNYSFVIMRILKGLLRLRFNLSLIPSRKTLFQVMINRADSEMEQKSFVKVVTDVFTRLFNAYINYKNRPRHMKSKIKVYSLSVQTCIGTGDAATTALICGGAFAFFYNIAYFLRETYNLQKQQIIVAPNFQRPQIDLDLDCIINFKLGHIIITGMKIFIRKSRR